ncbi:triose-phosphate isomerase [Arenibaculum sp.]|jgi:triosephosphate isomerase|uniref:triose-phosphate isomerase n=1 Tax=Arenibaculum sp. TaxID=2865862 RepID=UPI002E159B81|nr:triose-phosphate isomerase [Arenibaculum sp.]
MARRKLIAGNWKMNGLFGEGTTLAKTLADRLASAGPVGFDMLICPPATLVRTVAGLAAGSPLLVGGQDCHAKEKGAHTGDVSAEMLADAGAGHVIVGHSERRQDHRESDAVVRAKAEAAHRAGLVAIVCVGETREERDAGRAEEIVARQVGGSLPEGADGANTVIAYEPVWAIGTGLTATAADVAGMHAHIRRELEGKVASPGEMRILYGGSVKPSNAGELMAIGDVDGALVGGASLVADDFWAIAETCR